MKKNSFTYNDLIECAKGKLFGEGNAKLPLPPMLMMDRILKITKDGGMYKKGEIIAELDIKPKLWFFACHFKKDPVMPGCLGLDALWQLVGFFFRLAWSTWERKGIRSWRSEIFRRSIKICKKSKIYTSHKKSNCKKTSTCNC